MYDSFFVVYFFECFVDFFDFLCFFFVGNEKGIVGVYNNKVVDVDCCGEFFSYYQIVF